MAGGRYRDGGTGRRDTIGNKSGGFGEKGEKRCLRSKIYGLVREDMILSYVHY